MLLFSARLSSCGVLEENTSERDRSVVCVTINTSKSSDSAKMGPSCGFQEEVVVMISSQTGGGVHVCMRVCVNCCIILIVLYAAA